jgi:hypothetical protein
MMGIWENSLMITAFFDETPAIEDDDCVARIDEKSIEISYDDEDGNVIYRGKNDGSGHFELNCPERNGHASLHMFKNGKFVDGYWVEGGYKGFWRIELRN